MINDDYINPLLKLNVREPGKDDRRISYSQFAMYSTCPRRWELAYVKGLREFSQSIHTIFGTAFHETLQEYLTVMYTETAKKADMLPVQKLLQERMVALYKDAVEKTGEHFSTKFELQEFYEDGIAILDFIKKNRAKYFSAKHEELLGIEIPIYEQATGDNKSVMMLGYLDVVLRDKRTDRIKIVDIKTSTMGWNKYQKADKIKASQLVLYKEYFGKQYGYDTDKIDILYFIVKRKLIEGAMFPQKRVQEFIPASGKPTRNKLNRSITEWTSSCFDDEGNYNVAREYPAVAGKNSKNCKYCDFKDNDELCPVAKRIKE